MNITKYFGVMGIEIYISWEICFVGKYIYGQGLYHRAERFGNLADNNRTLLRTMGGWKTADTLRRHWCRHFLDSLRIWIK